MDRLDSIRRLAGALAAPVLPLRRLGTAGARSPALRPGDQPRNRQEDRRGRRGRGAQEQLEVAVAITDNHGMLVYYEMQDDTQTASATAAVEKARTSAGYRRPSKEFEDNVAAGRVAVIGLPDVTPIDGGLPIMVNGRMIGAIGVSGVTSAQDAQVARAGLEALK